MIWADMMGSLELSSAKNEVEYFETFFPPEVYYTDPHAYKWSTQFPPHAETLQLIKRPARRDYAVKNLRE